MSTGDEYGEFWNYLSPTQKDLILEGNFLMNDVIRHANYSFKDYSFLVFPYGKAFEGFLKKIFLDLGYISHLDYISDHFRLGKMMSPHLVERLGERSLYLQMKNHGGQQLADEVWQMWKVGRNEIFHYFPHNLKMITFQQAEEIIQKIIQTMESIYQKLYKVKNPTK